ncbi:MAG: flagellar motor protein MotB [Motiliproteus sp.]|nr:flagellar motor protein MotB [Motiliproteus sp.]MCW9053498.1 flagellar motor protein MotB [Motiliproteus sp.]
MNRRFFEDDSSDTGAWITTFADLMTLLLVFFILLYSMSSVEKERFQDAVESIQNSLSTSIPVGNFNKSSSIIELPKQHALPAPEPAPVKELVIEAKMATGSAPDQAEQDGPTKQWHQLANTIKNSMINSSLDKLVVLSMPKDGTISIQVSGAVLFDSGSSDLSYKADSVLDRLVANFKRHSWFKINIKGHSDDRPISTDRYESNWELSALRATTVLRYFISRGIHPNRLTATGYADSVPIASNLTDQGRTKNRRIEFVLEREQ